MFVVVALAASTCFATAIVLQQRAASTYGAHFALLHRPLWLAGIVVDGLGFGLHATALHLGGVVAVQALLTSQLPIGMLVGRISPGLRGWLGVALMAGGLVGVLLAAQPKPGSGGGRVLPVLIVGAVAIVLAAVPLPESKALSAGVFFALTATLAHGVGDQLLAGGLLAVLAHPQGYLLAASALSGLLIEQQAFANGPLAPTLVILTLVDPIASLGLGVVVAGDRVRGGPAAIVSAAFAVVVAAGVILISSRRGQLATEAEREAQAERADDGPVTGGHPAAQPHPAGH